jgi:hypothetical protein
MTETDVNPAAAELVDRYIATWNAADPAQRRDLIASTFAEGALYVDPIARVEGTAAIDAMIAGVQARFPGHSFSRFGRVDAHNDRLRFQWALAADSAEPLVIGTDVAVLSPDLRLQSVTGFFDKLPNPA